MSKMKNFCEAITGAVKEGNRYTVDQLASGMNVDTATVLHYLRQWEGVGGTVTKEKDGRNVVAVTFDAFPPEEEMYQKKRGRKSGSGTLKTVKKTKTVADVLKIIEEEEKQESAKEDVTDTYEDLDGDAEADEVYYTQDDYIEDPEELPEYSGSDYVSAAARFSDDFLEA